MNALGPLINGLALGTGYVLLALGWTVLLGAARLVNFSHGQLYMLGAFGTWWLTARAGVPYLIAIPLTLVAAVALGALMQVALTRLTLSQNVVALMLVTLAFGYVLEGGASVVFGGDPQVMASPFSGQHHNIAGASLSGQDIAIAVCALLLFTGVYLVLTRTRAGHVVRAVAEDPQLARLYGVNPARVYIGIFVFAAAAAALSGALIGPRSPILTSAGFEEVIIAFVVVVLGGIGSVVGTLIAGLGMGVFTAYFGAYVSPAYAEAAVFAVLLVVLVARPEGFRTR